MSGMAQSPVMCLQARSECGRVLANYDGRERLAQMAFMLKNSGALRSMAKIASSNPNSAHPLNEGVKYSLGWALDVGFVSNGHDGPETRLPVFSEQRNR
jgi:hypothetical protein